VKTRTIGVSMLIILMVVLVGSALAVAQDVIEIEVWHRWGGDHMKVFDELAADFNSKHPGIRVKGVSIPGTYQDLTEQIFARLAARQAPPDIVASGVFLVTYTATTFNAVNLETFVGDELSEVADRYRHASLLDIGKAHGIQYGLPFAFSNAVMYYNPKVFEEAGLDPDRPPATWDEVREYAIKIKENTSYSPMFISLPDSWLMAALVESNGGRMMTDGKATFDSPEAVEVLRMWRSFYEDGLIPQVSHTEAERAFPAGNVGMHFQSIMNLGPWSQSAPWVRVAPMPSFGDKERRLPAGGAVLLILSKDIAKAEAAWEFLKYCTTPEAMEIWVKTGYVNPLKEQVPLADPRQAVSVEQLEVTVPWVDWGGAYGLEIEQLILDTRDKILYGEVDAAKGLADCVKEVNRLLSL